jgi:esterase/lipase superfamily enzyme
MMRICKLIVGSVTMTAIAFIGAGCATQRTLMPTPLLMTEAKRTGGFEDTPDLRRKPAVDLLFVTDRSPQADPESDLPYGQKRSASIAFGSAVVDFGPNLSWAELERQSRLAERTRDVELTLGRTEELGRFPTDPYGLKLTPAGVIRSPQVMQHHRAVRSQFESEIKRSLAQSPTKEVVLYVHGFNETFATAAFTTSDLCHFLGRQHVCAFFTWPASSTGFLPLSYAETTESARFSFDNLKRTIRMIGKTPGVEGIQLLAHSRGADVLFSALRELAIEAVAAGVSPAHALKIDSVVMMAPDVDADLARRKWGTIESDPDMISRWSTKELPDFVKGRFTVYASPQDTALFVST